MPPMTLLGASYSSIPHRPFPSAEPPHWVVPTELFSIRLPEAFVPLRKMPNPVLPEMRLPPARGGRRPRRRGAADLVQGAGDVDPVAAVPGELAPLDVAPASGNRQRRTVERREVNAEEVNLIGLDDESAVLTRRACR